VGADEVGQRLQVTIWTFDQKMALARRQGVQPKEGCAELVAIADDNRSVAVGSSIRWT
jgi:hypothetical protein